MFDGRYSSVRHYVIIHIWNALGVNSVCFEVQSMMLTVRPIGGLAFPLRGPTNAWGSYLVVVRHIVDLWTLATLSAPSWIAPQGR
jgi:hypothetical protein